MENIERTQFVVLTGHLDDQPLPDLVRRLRVQRKSGRLQVEYPDAPGAFFFEDGQLVDAQLGTLRGVEAIYAALALDGASFNFNPLVRPPERSIDRQGQHFIGDLIEAPRREGLAEIKVAGREIPVTREMPALSQHEPRQLPPAAAIIAPLEGRLAAVEEAVISTSRRFSRERLIYGMIIGFLAGLSLVTTLGVMLDPFNSAPAPASAPASPVAAGDTAAGGDAARSSSSGAVVNRAQAVADKEQEGAVAVEREGSRAVSASNSNDKVELTTGQVRQITQMMATTKGEREAGDGSSAARGEYVVQVVVQVKGGRVTGARVWKPRRGARAYEAVAVKMVKERRYPENFTGAERVSVRVKL